MSWSLFYSLREGLDGLRRAKLASFIAIMSMAFALVVAGVLAIIAVNLVALVDAMRGRIEFEVFVDNALDKAGTDELRRQILAVGGVAEAQFISKEAAAEIFKREFTPALRGQDGQSLLEILDSNPLPASFRISLKKAYQNSAAAQRVASAIEKLRGVDEVVYRRDLALALDRYVQIALIAGSLVGLVFCLGALVLVVNDVRLVIHAKRRLIEIMQLVGATRAFVYRPLLVQGFLQGVVGGFMASGFLYLLYSLLLFQLDTALQWPNFLFVGLIGAGIVLGLTASYLGARKYIQ